MLDRNNRWPWLLLIASLVGGIVLGRGLLAPNVEPPEPIYLPAEVVIQEVVDQRQLDMDAATITRLELVNGELRDEVGRLVKVTETLRVDTGPVEVAEPIFVDRIVREACETGQTPIGRALLEAVKFEGLNEAGDLKYGWRGQIRCEIATTEAAEWAVLVDQPFTLANTRSQATEAPSPPERVPSRLGFYAGGSFPLSSAGDFASYQVPKSRGTVDFGGSIRLGKRWHVQLGGQYGDEWAVDARLLRYGWRR